MPERQGVELKKPVQDIRISTLGLDLRAAREANGWTIQQAENLTAWQPGTLERIEKGEIVPGLVQLRRLATMYGAKIVARDEAMA